MNEALTTTAEEDYLKAAIAFHEAREKNDQKTSNKAHDKLIDAARRIRLHNADGGEAFFASLLNHSMPHVAVWAAYNLIPFNPKFARKTLEKLAKGLPGEFRFNARMTLKEWKAGRLDPDWFMKK